MQSPLLTLLPSRGMSFRISLLSHLEWSWVQSCDPTSLHINDQLSRVVNTFIYLFIYLFILSLKASPVPKCQNITLGGSVRVSPSHCVTSNQDYGSTCSFSCARGYQVSGPSSTRCGMVGAWSDDENTVDCRGLYLVITLNSSPRVLRKQKFKTQSIKGWTFSVLSFYHSHTSRFRLTITLMGPFRL